MYYAINKQYFPILPYFIESTILAFWGLFGKKSCTILMDMNIDILFDIERKPRIIRI